MRGAAFSATRARGVTFAVALAAALGACHGDGPTNPPPGPTPTPAVPGATPGPATGPTRIALVAAEPLPGSVVGGCGADASGCAGRIRMTFRVTPTGNGTALFYVGFLHATNKTACLQGRAEGMALRAGEPQAVEIVFDQPDTSGRCRTPLDISDLAFNVEGTVEVASRQEWALAYRLAP